MARLEKDLGLTHTGPGPIPLAYHTSISPALRLLDELIRLGCNFGTNLISSNSGGPKHGSGVRSCCSTTKIHASLYWRMARGNHSASSVPVLTNGNGIKTNKRGRLGCYDINTCVYISASYMVTGIHLCQNEFYKSCSLFSQGHKFTAQ